MIDHCIRCNRRLRGLLSTHIGMGPVCMRKSRRMQEELKASGAQPDLFAGELVAATLSTRVQSLLARINALEEQKHVQRPIPPQT